MDWASVIEGNRVKLLRIVAALFALAGLEQGISSVALPRHARNFLLRILRPAESAVRRLVVMMARDLVVTLHPVSASITTGGTTSQVAGDPAFAVLDPLKDPTRPARHYARSIPRITFIGLYDPRPLPPAPSSDDPVEAAGLGRRLVALKRALDDMPRAAARLARWQARLAAGRVRRRAVALRPGYPPGRRKRATHEVDDVLRDCHALALHYLSPDTS